MKPILKPIFIQLAKILMPISQLAEPFVCDQGGGTPLVSDLDQVAEEEAFQPGRWSPGGWRRCGGRDNFFPIKKDFNLMLRGLTRRPRHLRIAWGRLRAAQWTPADVVYLDCWDLV